MDGLPDRSLWMTVLAIGGIDMENKPKLSRLSAMERQRRELDERIQTLRRKELLALPRQFGFESVDALVFALLFKLIA